MTVNLEQFGRRIGLWAVTWAPRIFVSLMVFPILYGILALLGYDNRGAAMWSAVVLGLIGLIVSFVLILKYLNKSPQSVDYRTIELIELLEKRLTSLETPSETLLAIADPEDREPKPKVEVPNLAFDTCPGVDAATERSLSGTEWLTLTKTFDETRSRLLNEMSNLSRRSNLNLAVGTMTTLLAGIGLIYIVLFQSLNFLGGGIPPTISDAALPWVVVSHYLPRLAVIVFAEIFAYFFLRLYKASLPDLKYYQNEITNVEMRLAALKAAILFRQNDSLAAVIESLSKTERNFTLKAGETTADIEKLKQESIDPNGLASGIVALLKAKL